MKIFIHIFSSFSYSRDLTVPAQCCLRIVCMSCVLFLRFIHPPANAGCSFHPHFLVEYLSTDSETSPFSGLLELLESNFWQQDFSQQQYHPPSFCCLLFSLLPFSHHFYLFCYSHYVHVDASLPQLNSTEQKHSWTFFQRVKQRLPLMPHSYVDWVTAMLELLPTERTRTIDVCIFDCGKGYWHFFSQPHCCCCCCCCCYCCCCCCWHHCCHCSYCCCYCPTPDPHWSMNSVHPWDLE